MNQKERGKNICQDIRGYGYTADWLIDPYGELFLIFENCLMRCTKPQEWNPVRPTYRSIVAREYGQRKLEYVSLFEKYR